MSRTVVCEECQLVIIGEILAISVPSQSSRFVKFFAKCKLDAMNFAVFQQLAPTALVDRDVLNGTKNLNHKRALCRAVCREHAAGKDFEVLRQHPLPSPMSTIWCKCSVETS